MHSDDDRGIEWFKNQSVRTQELVATLVAFPILAAIILLYLVLLPPDRFALLSATYLGLTLSFLLSIDYVRWRRRPTQVGFSRDGVHIEYRSRPSRLVKWESIGRVRLFQFLGAKQAGIKYTSGRWEGSAHIFGDAAMELKRRFDASGHLATS